MTACPETAIDDKQETVWKTDGLMPLTVDMGKEMEVAGFSYVLH